VRDSRSLTRKCYEGKTFGEEVPTWFGGSSLDVRHVTHCFHRSRDAPLTLPSSIQSLVDFAKRPYGLDHDLVNSTKFSLIALLRAESLAIRVNRRVEVDDEIGEAEEMISDAFGSMIQNIGQSWQELCQRHNPLKNWIWWDTLMQRLLILYHLFALDLLELANGTQPSNLFVKHALREVINLLRREVTKTDPVEAQRLITFLIETFISPENRVAFCTSWK